MADGGDRIEFLVETETPIPPRFDRLDEEDSDIMSRLGPLDQGRALIEQDLAQQATVIAGLSAPMDRFDDRVGRIERRLDPVEAPKSAAE